MTINASQQKSFFDAHCHLSFAPDPDRFAAWVAQRYAGAFSTTVSPRDFSRAQQLFAPWESLKVGFGAHPWWVSTGEVTARDIEMAAATIEQTPYIGEVGLDFGRNGLARSVFATEEETKAAQVDVLRSVFAACAWGEAEGGATAEDDAQGFVDARDVCRVFSFHAVRSADVILDLLQEYELLSGNAAIFHWFSGSSAQLQRARELGCHFSVNAFMLNTKRGREYAKAIPAGQLLVETDLPEETEDDADAEAFEVACAQYAEALDSAYDQLVALRGPDILIAIEKNVQRIFG